MQGLQLGLHLAGVACYYFDTCQTIGMRNENPAALKDTNYIQRQRQGQDAAPKEGKFYYGIS